MDQERLYGSSRVYVAQEAYKFVYTNAQQYGELFFVTPANYSFPKHQNSLQQSVDMDMLAEKVAEFDPLTDYLLLTGDPILFGLVFHMILENHKGQTIRLLKWRKDTFTYDVCYVKE